MRPFFSHRGAAAARSRQQGHGHGDGDGALRVAHVRKSFGGVCAVDDVSFELHAGEMLALIGPNGAGKTTCFNLINGQLKADAGSVKFNDTELLGKKPAAIWRLGVGRTFQIAEVFTSLTVLENVQLAMLSHAGNVWRPWRSAGAAFHDEALAALDRVGMKAQAERAMAVLAYGDVKRVELAMALAHAPRLLLMDEPTAGMASAERHALMALVQTLVREQHLAVLFTEHSMDVVFAHATRVAVLSRGQLIALGSPQAVRDDIDVQRAYFGTGSTFNARAATSTTAADA